MIASYNLTLTSVVFEFNPKFSKSWKSPDLTLTSVVFEYVKYPVVQDNNK